MIMGWFHGHYWNYQKDVFDGLFSSVNKTIILSPSRCWFQFPGWVYGFNYFCIMISLYIYIYIFTAFHIFRWYMIYNRKISSNCHYQYLSSYIYAPALLGTWTPSASKPPSWHRTVGVVSVRVVTGKVYLFFYDETFDIVQLLVGDIL